MPGQDASGQRDGCIGTRWLQSILLTQIWVWLLRLPVYMVCVVRQNLYLFSLYRNLDLNDRIFDYLLSSMAAEQTEDIPVCGRFVWPSGVVRWYHHEPSWSCSFWLCNWLRSHSVGRRPNPCTWCNTLPPDDYNVPDLVRVAVVAPIGNSDHSSLSAVIPMTQAVPNLCVSSKVFF